MPGLGVGVEKETKQETTLSQHLYSSGEERDDRTQEK
jgi:hypothetical protein